MIEITAEQVRWYRHYEGETIALALRDMAAGVMRLEFEKDHYIINEDEKGLHDYRAICARCGGPLGRDPRHTFQWADWQRAAHEMLMGEAK